jgi:hypothetical protein
MRVSKQKMPDGRVASDTPSRYAIRNAISAARVTVNVPVLSTHTLEFRTMPVTLARAPWEVENDR